MRKVAAQDHGCSQQTALQLYNASAVGLLMHALPLFTLRKLNWQQLEGDHWTCFGMRSATSHGVDARDGGGRAAGPGSHRLAVACSRGRPLCSDCTSPGTRSLPRPTASIKGWCHNERAPPQEMNNETGQEGLHQWLPHLMSLWQKCLHTALQTTCSLKRDTKTIAGAKKHDVEIVSKMPDPEVYNQIR